MSVSRERRTREVATEAAMPTTMMAASEFALPESASKNSECEWNADFRCCCDDLSVLGVELNALTDPPACTGVQLAICEAVGNVTSDKGEGEGESDSGAKFSTRVAVFLTWVDVTLTGEDDPAWVLRLAPYLVLNPDRLFWMAGDAEDAPCVLDAARTRG